MSGGALERAYTQRKLRELADDWKERARALRVASELDEAGNSTRHVGANARPWRTPQQTAAYLEARALDACACELQAMIEEATP